MCCPWIDPTSLRRGAEVTWRFNEEQEEGKGRVVTPKQKKDPSKQSLGVCGRNKAEEIGDALMGILPKG